MYKALNPSEAFVAGKDIITGSYIQLDKAGNVMIFFSVFFLSVGLILSSSFIKNNVLGSLVTGVALILIGGVGTWVGIVDKIWAMCIVITFALVGVVVIYKALFSTAEKEKALNEEYDNTILLKVEKIIDNRIYILREYVDGVQKRIFIYNNGECMNLFLDSRYSFDIRKVGDLGDIVEVVEYRGYDISHVNCEEFKELGFVLNKVMEKAEQ